jgi:oxygen-independent coproporphyrinogen-3 oxidase
MAGIYIHVPFCKQACSYCDFHFSTSTKYKTDLVNAIVNELLIRNDYLNGEKVSTIYFGGGTPSLLNIKELDSIFNTLYKNYSIIADHEITFEANPDDLTATYLRELKTTPINRLSIGVQSFKEEHLKIMHRAHHSEQAKSSVAQAAEIGFENISIDLIYGIQSLGFLGWQENIKEALALPIHHISCYCLTVEPKTLLAHQIKEGKATPINDLEANEQFNWWLLYAEENGFPWYEVSNFSKPGFESKHNSNYWNRIPYLGVGPSAHSFNGTSRQWNIRNNPQYIQSLAEGIIPFEMEVLTNKEIYNETILTSLRTRRGIDKSSFQSIFGLEMTEKMQHNISKFIEQGLVQQNEESIRLTNAGLLFTDAISSELFEI